MPGIKLSGFEDCDIYDIRQRTECLDLRREIIKGLSARPAELPSLLLWDDNGQEFFDRFSQTPSYYPFHSEIEVLDRYATDIGKCVPRGSALIELGCGALRKTKSILSVFDRQRKPIHYYALDVSLQGLTNSILGLTKALGSLQYVKIQGLLGTYEDCVSWLSGANNLCGLSGVSFLWMGNSITNCGHYSEASTFLSNFRKACEQSSLRCQFLVSVDICQKPAKVIKAYNEELTELQDFISNGLAHANTAIGHDMFRPEDWSSEVQLCLDEHSLHVYYTARSDVQVFSSGKSAILFHKGQRVKAITSGKWTEAVMEQISTQAGLQIQRRWKDACGDYCIYSLLSNERQGNDTWV